MALDLHETGVLPIFRECKRRKGNYEHKEQVSFYENIKERDNCYLDTDESDNETQNGDVDLGLPASEHFRKHYRFCPSTVKALCLLLGNEIKPLATTNHAFTEMQRLCIALRFYATGSHQMCVGDGEGASQASVSRIVKQVTTALSNHSDDLIAFHIDEDVLSTVAKGFYGFSGSM